jgi:hypothetical protein
VLANPPSRPFKGLKVDLFYRREKPTVSGPRSCLVSIAFFGHPSPGPYRSTSPALMVPVGLNRYDTRLPFIDSRNQPFYDPPAMLSADIPCSVDSCLVGSGFQNFQRVFLEVVFWLGAPPLSRCQAHRIGTHLPCISNQYKTLYRQVSFS